MSTIKVDTIATRTGSGNITLSNSLASATIAGDLAVDTNTLFVDASENKVGIGTTTPDTFADYVSTSLTNTLTIAGSFPGLQLSDTDISGSQSTFGMSKAGQGLIFNNLGSGDMQYFLNGGERVRFQASGGISFNGDTAAANALDDYEEGTWTPALSSQAGTHNLSQVAGRYQKIGDFCTARFWINFTAFNGNGSYGILLTGLPFTSATQIVTARDIGQIFGAGYENIPILNSNYHILGGYLTQSATTATFRMSGGGQSERSLDGSIAKGGGYMYGEVRYNTA